MNLQQVVLLAVQASILLTLFGFGLQATRDDLPYLVRRPSMLVRSMLAMFVVMPMVVIVLGTTFSFRAEVGIALVALAISPVPPLLPKKQGKAGGRASFAIGLMTTAALLSIVVVPLAVDLLGRYFAQPFQVAPSAIAALALKTVLVPLFIGMLFRFVWPAMAKRIDAAVVVAILVGSFAAIRAEIGDGTVAAMAVFVIAGLTAGHLLGGPDPQDRIVLALSTACRHPGVALAIVAANFPGTRVGATVFLFLIVSAVLCLPYIAWQQRMVTKAA